MVPTHNQCINNTFFQILAVFYFFSFPHSLYCQEIPAHVHNDYENESPLSDAINHNINSIEVDIHAKGDSLKVAHLRLFGLKNKPTLRSQYLDPLKELIDESGYLFKDRKPILIMIDFKSRNKSSLKILRTILKEYKSYLLTTSELNCNLKKQIKFMLSGRIPIDQLTLEDVQYFNIDGRFFTRYPVWLKPYITRFSYPYRKALSKSKKQLNKLVEAAHQSGKQVRFYAAPSNEKIWDYLLSLNVDFINVDDIKKFTTYFKQKHQIE